MIVKTKDYKCRICGCSEISHNYSNYECSGCSVIFRSVSAFSLNRQLKVQYLPEYDLEKWGELNYAKLYDSGIDLRACMNGPKELEPYRDSEWGKYKTIVSAGIKIEPSHNDMDIKIYPRSGLGFKYDIRLSNSTGIVDSQFRGEVKMAIVNMGSEPYIIHPGDRIAQMVVEKRLDVEVVKVDQLGETERGEGGFGSTGKN